MSAASSFPAWAFAKACCWKPRMKPSRARSRIVTTRKPAEHVRELSLMLFDQLQAVHHLPQQARVQLESGALLHDVGHRVSHRGHHKHGEYLALNGDIPGLQGRDRS